MIGDSITNASKWLSPEYSYGSILVAHPFGDSRVTFRRDPNKHFDEIAAQLVKMLVQDLVVILDEMMFELLTARSQNPANFPQSKVQQLRKHLPKKYE
jgi:hypothetical protein